MFMLRSPDGLFEQADPSYFSGPFRFPEGRSVRTPRPASQVLKSYFDIRKNIGDGVRNFAVCAMRVMVI